MGGLNIKLMQGIEETENQVQKQTQELEGVKRKETGISDTKETTGRSQKAKEQSKVKKNTTMRKNSEKEADKIQKKQVFSFRAMVSDITVWKAYAIATGQAIESIGNNAMHEYLMKHKLSGAEQVIFDAIKARDSNDGE